MKRDLTKEEKSAIRRLKSLAKVWPKSLWIFSGSGTLNIMGTDKDNHRVLTKDVDYIGSGGGVDPEYVIDTINIPNDGGDW